ncbi:MAG TPA: SRPBCC domain-containing protein [Woeseiaceae bacterium]|jgi:carbon monoxide dehydrogenase subunit G|nr:SRPBCC domain-containing protein [Woeseiaceae bacterium]
MAVVFEGDFVVDRAREDVFAALADADRFPPLLPTYQSHELRDDGSADVAVKVGVGKIHGTALVNLKPAEQSPPESAAWSGKGRIMGGAFNLTAAFDLDALGPTETRVRWQGDLTIFGKLTSLAGGFIEPAARKQIRHLIDAIRNALGEGAVQAAGNESI